MKRPLPKWCKEVKKAMIDKDMQLQELATGIGLSLPYVTAVTNGKQYSETCAKKISDYLEIEFSDYIS